MYTPSEAELLQRVFFSLKFNREASHKDLLAHYIPLRPGDVTYRDIMMCWNEGFAVSLTLTAFTFPISSPSVTVTTRLGCPMCLYRRGLCERVTCLLYYHCYRASILSLLESAIFFYLFCISLHSEKFRWHFYLYRGALL